MAVNVSRLRVVGVLRLVFEHHNDRETFIPADPCDSGTFWVRYNSAIPSVASRLGVSACEGEMVENGGTKLHHFDCDVIVTP